MKNKKIFIFAILIIFFNLSFSYSNEKFNFDITEVEITDNGNFFRGLDRGTATTNEGNVIITADEFEYNKITNILKAIGNVIFEDKIKNYIIESNYVVYYKDNEVIISRDKTKAFVESKYEILTSEISLDRNLNILTSDKKSVIIDDENTQYETDILNYSINTNIFKGTNVKVLANINQEKSERDNYNFKNGIFDLEKKEFSASETKIFVKKNIFDQDKNDPRIYGKSSEKKKNITKINKGVFTSCEQGDGCPPWSIKAKSITHDQNKKDIIYEHPILRLYDFPVFYFPKFTHPDPTVRRRSGFLQPQLNNSDITGSSLLIPYFNVLSETEDMTFKPTIFDSDIYMLQSEYRKTSENYNLIADIGLTKGYQENGQNRNNIGHLFAKLTSNLNFDNFLSSGLNFSFQKTTKDTFLKIFEPNLIDMHKSIKPNPNKLKTEMNINLEHESYNFDTGILAYERLAGKNSDRYQYVLPYYNFSRQVFNNNFLNIDFSSSGDNNLLETNQLTTSLNNSINIVSNDFFSDFGFSNRFQTYFKNLNSVTKNVDATKSSPNVDLKNIINLETSLPLFKYDKNYINTITPKASFRINPTDMNNASNKKRTITANNLFDINRLGLNDFEQGKSLTLGLDYKKESLLDINKYFEMKFGGVLRDVKQNNIPTSSSINQKASNLFGSINYAMSDNIGVGYDFSLDNDFSTFEQNSINLGFSFIPISEEKKRFNTSFSFSESNGKQGDANVLSNNTTINFDDNNYLTFSTRRNRKINFTEYYNLVYEYKNDCLVAGIKFNKSFYQDRDLKPKEELLFTITFFPITQYDQKIDENAWR